MDNVQPSQPNANITAPRIRASDYKEVYSNSSVNSLTPFDVTICFQRLSELAPGHVCVLDQVSVTMAPQHFKAVVRSMVEVLAAYEASFGKLEISDADTAPGRVASEISEMIDANRKAVASLREGTDRKVVSQKRKVK